MPAPVDMARAVRFALPHTVRWHCLKAVDQEAHADMVQNGLSLAGAGTTARPPEAPNRRVRQPVLPGLAREMVSGRRPDPSPAQ